MNGGNRTIRILPMYLTTFYREGVQLKTNFKTCRKQCSRFIRHPHIQQCRIKMKLLKMSRLSNVEAKDSLLVKVKSGIQACIQMDIIKDMPEFLIPNIENSIYTYTSEV